MNMIIIIMATILLNNNTEINNTKISNDYLVENGFKKDTNKEIYRNKLSYYKSKKLFSIENEKLLPTSNVNSPLVNGYYDGDFIFYFDDNWTLLFYNLKYKTIDQKIVIDYDQLIVTVVFFHKNTIPAKKE